jgi:DNA-binding CsgD family transcriptional regulator
MLQPHIKRAAQIAARLAASKTAEDAKARALDQIDHGVLLVDRMGCILFTNRAAQSIISLGDGLAMGAHGLWAESSADNRRLEALIAEAANGAAGGTMRVSRPSLAEPWLLLVAPARSPMFRAVDAGAAAIIFVTDPERAPMPSQEILSDLFGLTATEAKVALCISAGHDVPSAARQLRVSTNTVHTHLRRIFSKLGVHRQADVVRVLMRAGIAARSDVAGRAGA